MARFGLFELDLTTGELFKNGRPVRLQPQPLQVLLLLVERAGELVTREELQERVWGDGTVVAYDQGLNYCVRQVRAALGDHATAPAFVETVPRRGYRFVAPVGRGHSSERFSSRLRGWWVAAAAGVVIAIAALIALRGPSEADDPTMSTGPGVATDRVRLVVLPLLDLSQQGPAMPQAEAFERARESARQALALDPELAEAHNSLAFVRLYHDWDPEAAVEGFERSLELAPGYAMAHHWGAAAYASLGRFDEAIAAAQRAAELDPVSLSVRSDLGWYHLITGHWQQALDECNRALALSPGYGFADGCRDQARKALGLPTPEQPSEEALRNRLEEQAASGAVYPLGMAWDWAMLGELDRAFRWLDRAVEDRDVWMVFLWVDRRFEPLWGDPRFREVATRVGIGRPVVE